MVALYSYYISRILYFAIFFSCLGKKKLKLMPVLEEEIKGPHTPK